jgi:N,N'-diacetyllegionaminate synthase
MLKNNNTIIIAEACDNHFGSLSNAFKMVDLAKKSGADIIKFQHHLPDEEMLKNVPKSKNFKISLYNFLKKYALKIEDHYQIKNYCKRKKIKYLCTPFSFKAALEINKLGVDTFKIGSGEFLDLFFIEKMIKLKKDLIFSTGMSNEAEVNFMHKKISKLKNKSQNIAFMHCTSEYPPNSNDLNLRHITQMIKKYPKFYIGHSDHTNDIYTSIAAVSLGAKIIEKHVYLDGLNHGPDKDVSISFSKLKNLVSIIRKLEPSLGARKFLHQKEKIIRAWAHRSIVSTTYLPKNKILGLSDITTKRPGTGIPSIMYKKVIGKKLKKNVLKNTLLKKSDFVDLKI